MSRTDLPRWSLTLALLVVPASLQAQASTLDSAAASAARKTKQPEVICRDGTSASAQDCASHGGVDAVTTNASRTGRADHTPVETGQVDTAPKPSGQPAPPPNSGTGTSNPATTSSKPDNSQPAYPPPSFGRPAPDGWGKPWPAWPGDSAQAAGDSGR